MAKAFFRGRLGRTIACVLLMHPVVVHAELSDVEQRIVATIKSRSPVALDFLDEDLEIASIDRNAIRNAIFIHRLIASLRSQ